MNFRRYADRFIYFAPFFRKESLIPAAVIYVIDQFLAGITPVGPYMHMSFVQFLFFKHALLKKQNTPVFLSYYFLAKEIPFRYLLKNTLYYYLCQPFSK